MGKKRKFGCGYWWHKPEFFYQWLSVENEGCTAFFSGNQQQTFLIKSSVFHPNSASYSIQSPFWHFPQRRLEMTLQLSPPGSQSLSALPGCCLQCRWRKQALVRLSLVKVLVLVQAEHLTCFIPSAAAFTPLLWWAGVRPSREALQEQASLGDLYQKIPGTPIKSLLSSLSPQQHHSPSLLLFHIDFCLKVWKLWALLARLPLWALTLVSDPTAWQHRGSAEALINFCLLSHTQ